MPITLEQAKVGLADKVVQSVIDELRRGSFILDKLTFDNAVSPGTGGSTLTYGYTRLKTPSMAQGRKLNSEYTAGEAIREKATVDLKIFGGAFEVDRVLEGTAATSEIAFQLSQKTIAAKNKFHFDFMNGDSATHETDFDGIDKLVTGTATEIIPAAAIDLSDADKIEANARKFALELDRFLKKLNGKPSCLLVNGTMLPIMNQVAGKLGFYSRIKTAFGEDVDAYKGIPLVDMETYFNGTDEIDVIPVSESTGETSVYAIQLALDGVHGVSPTGDKIVKAYLPNMKDPGAVKKGEVEMVAAVALKNTKKAGCLRKIKVQ